MLTNQTQFHISRQKMLLYLRDELPEQESRVLELHLAECPFCADALEGAEALPAGRFEAGLQDLDDKLAKKYRKKTIPLFRYTGLAAAVILLLISAFWALKITENENKIVAESSPAESPTATEEQRFDNHKNDISEADEAAFQETESKPLSRGEAESPDEEENKELIVSNLSKDNKRERLAEGPPKLKERQEQSVVLQEARSAAPAEDDLVTGAEIEAETADEKISEEAKGIAPEPVIAAAEKKDKNQQKKASGRLSDLLPVMPADTLYTESALPARKNDNFRPVGGHDLFQEYVQKNRSSAFDTLSISGETELEFSVRNGRPVRIKVTEKFRPDCDKEAIRLLKTGPKWERIGLSEGRQKVRIPFAKH